MRFLGSSGALLLMPIIGEGPLGEAFGGTKGLGAAVLPPGGNMGGLLPAESFSLLPDDRSFGIPP